MQQMPSCVVSLYRSSCVLAFLREAAAVAAQGSGKQARGAVVNLVAFYAVGIPLALTLAFGLQLGAAGLLLGLLAGSAVQVTVLVLVPVRSYSPARATVQAPPAALLKDDSVLLQRDSREHAKGPDWQRPPPPLGVACPLRTCASVLASSTYIGHILVIL